jgi:hypothetical protein
VIRWHVEARGDTARTYTGRDAAGAALDYREVLRRWQRDEAFVDGFIGLLAAVPFDAYLWESPPVDRSTVARRFEFTVIDRPALARAADPSPFSDPFDDADGDAVVRFTNLGGDAVLVAPKPEACADGVDCAHLAAFTRSAPPQLQHRLWRRVADEMQQRVSTRPVWLSTSGLGVAWLHVRLDQRPKYYEHAPYRRPPDHDHD